jgi:hypothetical protein
MLMTTFSINIFDLWKLNKFKLKFHYLSTTIVFLNFDRFIAFTCNLNLIVDLWYDVIVNIF